MRRRACGISMLICLVLLLGLAGGRVSRAQTPLMPDLGHPLLRSLQGWWRAWSGVTSGTTWYDLVGRQHATLANMGYSSTSGWTVSTRRGGGWAVAFDGTDDAGSIADTPGIRMDLGDQFTWAFWTKTTYAGGTRLDWLQKTAGDFTGFQLEIASGQVYCLFFQASSANLMGRLTTPTMNDGAWHHITCTYAGTSADSGFALYIDGQAVATTAAGVGSLTGSVATTANLLLVAGGSFATAMDDLRFWRRTLTAQEIATVYQQSLLGDPALFPRQEDVGAPLAANTGAFFPFFQ